MKKIIIMISIVFASLAVIGFIGMTWFIGNQVFSASTQLVTNEDTSGVPEVFVEQYNFDFDTFNATYEIETMEIASSFGEHQIPADYIYAPTAQTNKNHPTVILVHGMEGNRYETYPWAEYFLEKGFNVIAYDQRSSNENEAQYTTFGYWEKHDLIDWMQYAKAEAPGQTLGVWGVSYGGATAGLAMADKEVEQLLDFLILESPVSSMQWMVEEEMRKMDIGIPISYMTWSGNLINRLELGFSYDDADVAAAMKSVEIPVLLINSEADTVTPYFMGEDIYKAIPEGNKQQWTVADSEHFQIWLDYQEEYENTLDEFLADAL